MNPVKPKDPVLEPMADFFAARVEGYDAHMLANVEGCREAYPLVAELVPAEARHILDLGCGTGLELDYLLPQRPAVDQGSRLGMYLFMGGLLITCVLLFLALRGIL